MTTQNYLMIENNVVVNTIVWDGDSNTWMPPVGATMLLQATTLAGVWVLNSDKTDWVLTEMYGLGSVGFTWDGIVLTTNEPKPDPIVQPTTNTKTA